MPKDTINNMPLHKKIKDYAEEAKKGLLDRREFLAYATALGATTATAYGLLGLAALVQVCATLPQNYIAFEYPIGEPEWWYDIVEGLPSPIVKDGFIEVWDQPGMGVNLIPEATKPFLKEEDQSFFD